MECGCTISMPDEWQVQTGNTITFDVGRIIIEYCPLHAAAQETARQRDALLEAVKGLLNVADGYSRRECFFCGEDAENNHHGADCPGQAAEAAIAQATKE